LVEHNHADTDAADAPGGAEAMTAEQRYWRAIREAALIHEAKMIRFLAGQDDALISLAEIERQLLIAEIQRALSGT